MDISVIIITYNEEKHIKDCLDSLTNQTRKADEIILVDDGSADETLEIAEKYPIKIIKLKHKERSHARNVGWKQANGEYILFTEADSVFSNNWIEEIIKKFNDGADAVIDRRKMFEPKTLFQKTMNAQLDIRYANYQPFSAWAFKREVLEATGGFDEKLTQSEDRELGKRVVSAGYKIKLAERALQYHKGEPQNIVAYLKRAFNIEKKRVAQGYYDKFRKEIPNMNLAFLFINILFISLSLMSWIYLYILLFLVFAFYFYLLNKIAFVEKGYGVVSIKYIINLAFYRFIRSYAVAAGYIAGKL